MIVTADERRNVLNLFNVSEAARQLGVDVFRLHRDIKAGRVPSPKIRLGRRLYFTSDEIGDLSERYAGFAE
jgi:predicted site-specific integrase-resolvase